MRYGVIMFIVLLLLTSSVSADGMDELYPKANRFSISLFGGVTLSQEGAIWSTTRGNFDVQVGYSPAFGGSILYSVSQPFSLEFRIVSGMFESHDDVAAGNQFRNDYLYFSGRGLIYLSNIFQTYRMSDRINPYIFAGIGYMNIDVTEMAGPDINETVSTVLGGLGMKIRATRFFDVFAQYEFTVADSDLLDGRRASHPRDMWGTVTAGVTVNLGSMNRQHIRWQQRDRIIDETLIAHSRKMASLERANRELEEEYNQQREIYRELDGKLALLEAELSALDAKIEALPDARVIRFEPTIIFEHDSHQLWDQAKAMLDSLSVQIRDLSDVHVLVIGHTDNVGPASYNLELSRQRATMVADYLIQSGVPVDRVRVEGRGEEEPAASNATETGRRLNRRVVIELQ
jgi:outer membrane protein OmpA-like peptidoglycan-associated protein